MHSFPPLNKFRSQTELQNNYLIAVRRVESLTRERNANQWAAKGYRSDRDNLKGKASSLEKKVLHLTKQQQATEEAKACGYWSGAASICVTMTYLVMDEVGFPFGWEDFWSHYAVNCALVNIATIFFAWLYKTTQK